MSRVFKDHSAYERECAERAALARAGRIDTHAVQQVNITQEWQAPDNWVHPVVAEEKN